MSLVNLTDDERRQVARMIVNEDPYSIPFPVCEYTFRVRQDPPTWVEKYVLRRPRSEWVQERENVLVREVKQRGNKVTFHFGKVCISETSRPIRADFTWFGKFIKTIDLSHLVPEEGDELHLTYSTEF